MSALAISNIAALHRTFGNQATMSLLRGLSPRDATVTTSNRPIQRKFFHGGVELTNHAQILLYLWANYPKIMGSRGRWRLTRAQKFEDWATDTLEHQLGKWLAANNIPVSADTILEAAAAALLEPMITAPPDAKPEERQVEKGLTEEKEPSSGEISWEQFKPGKEEETTTHAPMILEPFEPGEKETAYTEMSLEQFVTESTPSDDEDLFVPELGEMTVEADTRTPATKRKRTRKKASPTERPQKRQRGKKKEEESLSETESLDIDLERRVSASLENFKPRGDVPLMMITWNIQKYGTGTRGDLKAMKRRVIARILDQFHPTAFVLQEVADASLLFEGSKRMTTGLLRTNLLTLDPTAEYIGEKGNPLEFGKTGVLRHYPVAHEYKVESGPLFHSFSGNYAEYYPLMYDAAQVVRPPTAYYVEGTKNSYKLVECSSEDTLPFSSSPLKGFPEAKTRPLLVWEIEVQTQGYSFRENPRQTPRAGLTESEKESRAWMKQGRQEGLESEALRDTKTIYLGVVHTSPSNDIGIEQETAELLNQGEWLKRKFGDQVVLAGDWYMERQSPETFDAIVRGVKWQMGAPPQDPSKDVPHKPTERKRKTFKSKKAKKFMPTNLAKKKGHASQTADMFVLSKSFDISFTTAISLNTEKFEGWQEGEYLEQGMNIEKDLFKPIEKVGVDHVAVITVFYA